MTDKEDLLAKCKEEIKTYWLAKLKIRIEDGLENLDIGGGDSTHCFDWLELSFEEDGIWTMNFECSTDDKIPISELPNCYAYMRRFGK